MRWLVSIAALSACADAAHSRNPRNDPPAAGSAARTTATACVRLPLRKWQTAVASPLKQKVGYRYLVFSDGRQFLVVESSPPRDAALYDPCADRWTSLDAEQADAWLRRKDVIGPLHRYEEGVRIGRKRVVFPASRSTSMAQFDNATIVDLASGKQVKVARAHAPTERYANGGIPGNHLELPIGNAVFVWGGSGHAGYARDGAVLDVASGRWRRIATRGAPSGRDAPNAVWTGREVIVWGGLGDAIRARPSAAPTGRVGFTDGARYDPRTDTWSKLSDAGAPSARGEPVIGWTGTSFLSLGGSPPDQPGIFTVGAANVPAQRAGGLYDPRTNRWRPLASPAGFGSLSRQVLSGPAGLAVLGDGGLAVLDEPSATWTVLPAHGAFGGDYGWSGTILLVFRGFDPGPPGPTGCEGVEHACDPVSRSSWMTEARVIRLF